MKNYREQERKLNLPFIISFLGELVTLRFSYLAGKNHDEPLILRSSIIGGIIGLAIGRTFPQISEDKNGCRLSYLTGFTTLCLNFASAYIGYVDSLGRLLEFPEKIINLAYRVNPQNLENAVNSLKQFTHNVAPSAHLYLERIVDINELIGYNTIPELVNMTHTYVPRLTEIVERAYSLII
jgi:hypothetical protein